MKFLLLFLAMTAVLRAQNGVTPEEESLLIDKVIAKQLEAQVKCDNLDFYVEMNEDDYTFSVDCLCDDEETVYTFDSTYVLLTVEKRYVPLKDNITLLWSLGANSATLLGFQYDHVYADVHVTWNSKSYLKPYWVIRDTAVQNLGAVFGFNLSFVLPLGRFKVFTGFDMNFKKIRDGYTDGDEEIPADYKGYVSLCGSVNYYFKNWMLGIGTGYGTAGRMYFVNFGLSFLNTLRSD